MKLEWKFPFVWFDVVTWRDARALRKWWDSHTIDHFYVVPSRTNPRFYAVVRTSSTQS